MYLIKWTLTIESLKEQTETMSEKLKLSKTETEDSERGLRRLEMFFITTRRFRTFLLQFDFSFEAFCLTFALKIHSLRVYLNKYIVFTFRLFALNQTVIQKLFFSLMIKKETTIIINNIIINK